MANILVCDDDREIVDAIEIYLSQDGYKIYKAYDGEQAIQILDKETGGYPSVDHGYHDAPAGWHTGYIEDPGIQQHSHYYPVGQIGRHGQDPGAEYRCG